ncbi:HAD-IB family hydrolase [Candidatus Kaiserbacteria bacterium CG_4_9_14_0_2_um_filter_41_32]|uniref:phosphoserine phosphatase n=1 Tax=Candidatus Kaiserbacteria bacterium CG_4_9_14_0_2_um_filter_41_32 TaxID=1974601 RepID=A0A2M8FE76_9BACT|nr:MAG: HAD-IB family hydrolase [Candidatus Kaiserbacteria bacterium CG_4_9_14_0_2_um_filter_41_32]
MQPVAFFDIDGTVFRSSLLIELVENLVKEGFFPVEVQDEYRSAYTKWRNREGTYEEYIDAVIKAFLHHIQGVHYGTFADIGKRLVAIHSKHVYRYTRDLIKSLKEDGYFVVAISQSPKTILDQFCMQYGFDKVYGRIYEIGPQDQFTGAITDAHLIENKATIVKRVFENNPNLTTKNSMAVGDTEGDIPLLDGVEQPICFNPNQALYNHAKLMGWEVVVERKDVIYYL